MTYRNETDALRARVDELEGNLAAAEDRIAKLSGEKTSDAVVREVRENRIIGGSSGTTLTQTLPYELDTEGYEAIATLVRERLKVEVSQVGHSLTTPGDVFTLRREEGRTTIRLHGDWASLAGAIVSAGGLMVLFGGLPALGVLHDVTGPASMLHAMWIIPSLVTGAVWLARGRAQKLAKRFLAERQGTFEAVLAIAEKHAIRPDIPRARIAVEEDEDASQEAETATAKSRA